MVGLVLGGDNNLPTCCVNRNFRRIGAVASAARPDVLWNFALAKCLTQNAMHLNPIKMFSDLLTLPPGNGFFCANLSGKVRRSGRWIFEEFYAFDSG